MPDISDILKRARQRERIVQVCIAGDVAADVEALEAELDRVKDEHRDAPSLAGKDPAEPIRKKIDAARKRMRAAEVPFRVRALGNKAYSDLLAAHPGKNKSDAFDPDTFPQALIAACAVDPVMTLDQVNELIEVINQGQFKELFDAAWEVNNEATSIPFSLRGSGILDSLIAGK